MIFFQRDLFYSCIS